MSDLMAYDVIGDVHGCLDAFVRLTRALGYDRDFRHPEGRRLVFVGDLIDRGPNSLEMLRLGEEMVRDGRAQNVLGNHDDALRRWLNGEVFDTKDGKLDRTIAQIEAASDFREIKPRFQRFLNETPLWLSLDDGRLLIVHAGIEPGMRENPTPEIRRFMLNGDKIGTSPEGKTLRRDWAENHRGAEFIVYGHTPQVRAEIRYNTVNIDTGAYWGRTLTALRWPERVLAYVPAVVA